MNLISQIINIILTLLPKDKFKELVDALLDKIEDMVANSENKIDDAIVLPLCAKVRELLDVPDNDDVN